MRGRLIVVFLGCSMSFCYMRSPDLFKIQCFKSTSQLCMLDLVYEMMIMGWDAHQTALVSTKRIILIKRVRLRDFARLGVILPLGANFDWTWRSLLK